MSERLRIPKDIAAEMVDYCEANTPNEACALLALKGETAIRLLPLTNAAASPVRYALDPREQLAAYNLLDENGWDFAVVHSHTRTDAYPSPTDVREAREDVPYVIVSLASDPPDIRAFRILKADWLDDAGTVEEVPVDLQH